MTARKRPQARPSVRDYRGEGAGAERPSQGTPGAFLPVSFTVPTNPKPWQRVQSKGGQRFTAPETRAYQALVRLAAVKAGATPTPGPVRLVVRAYRASEQRCDLDNLTKTIQDALNGVAYADDSQIRELYALKFVDRENPRAEVEVHPYPAVVERVLSADDLAAWWAERSEGL